MPFLTILGGIRMLWYKAFREFKPKTRSDIRSAGPYAFYGRFRTSNNELKIGFFWSKSSFYCVIF